VFDHDAREVIAAVLKATYELSTGGEPRVADEQDPLELADRYAGEPGKSGLLAEAELVLPKPASDVHLTAHACAPRPGTRSMPVIFQAGSRTQQAVVHGERWRIGRFGVRRISRPEPFERIPLTWENAFGGTDETPKKEKHRSWQPDNPVGRGYFAKRSQQKPDEQPLPNIEHPKEPFTARHPRSRPVGFLPVAPFWEPRARWAGTYDEAWMEEQCPLLPDDYDERHRLTAPNGLRGDDTFRGGEEVVVRGTVPEGTLRFRIPTVEPRMRLLFPHGAIRLNAVMDTVHVDTDRMRLHLVWRAAQVAHGQVDSLLGVEATLNGNGAAA
jgi:hypothetical protein